MIVNFCLKEGYSPKAKDETETYESTTCPTIQSSEITVKAHEEISTEANPFEIETSKVTTISTVQPPETNIFQEQATTVDPDKYDLEASDELSID